MQINFFTVVFLTTHTGEAFFESPEKFRPRRAIGKNVKRSFYKAVILRCLWDKKYLAYNKLPCLETSLLTGYSVNHCPRNRPERFLAFEKHTPEMPAQTHYWRCSMARCSN